jgi:hypothetical protein
LQPSPGLQYEKVIDPVRWGSSTKRGQSVYGVADLLLNYFRQEWAMYTGGLLQLSAGKLVQKVQKPYSTI